MIEVKGDNNGNYQYKIFHKREPTYCLNDYANESNYNNIVDYGKSHKTSYKKKKLT